MMNFILNAKASLNSDEATVNHEDQSIKWDQEII